MTDFVTRAWIGEQTQSVSIRALPINKRGSQHQSLPVLVSNMWTTVESSTLVSSMLFRTDIPMYVRTSWTVVRRTDTKFWIRRIYVERQGCLKRVLVYGPEVRRSLRKRRRSVRCPLC